MASPKAAMASPNVHLFTTDIPSGARSVVYKGFVIVNKVKNLPQALRWLCMSLSSSPAYS